MNKKESILIVGSSGFLGWQITESLGSQQNIIKTHYRNSLYPDSIKYDFFNEDIGYILDKQHVTTVIFASSVEINDQLDKVKISMGRFARSCDGRRIIYLSSDGIFGGTSNERLRISSKGYDRFKNRYCKS